ncbi:MAG TPA: hypothetical protein VEK08_20160 [Planctomycetota bacterium]|nr:hypothetical protein [Planctomycetota bacterium]
MQATVLIVDDDAAQRGVADVYDALVSQRPYKPPLPRASAIQILREKAGRGALDPELVRIFIENDVPSALEQTPS